MCVEDPFSQIWSHFATADSISTSNLVVGALGIAPVGMKMTIHIFSKVNSLLVNKPDIDSFLESTVK